jgi:mannose-6-phosphate isomerase
MKPIILSSNQPPNRFYLGGQKVSDFRGEQISTDSRVPEDWIASTTTCRGHSTLGLSRLPDGSLLPDAIQADPQSWLGPDHIKEFGIDTKLLVKLIDAGQRLPVHAHPSGAFASENLGALHGKAEAWYILTPGEVFIGLRHNISAEDLLKIVKRQDVASLLSLMHRIPVIAHQTVYVPPGVLHAIGKGVFLAEVQEPEDLSILLEWRDFAIDGSVEGHLGLGFEKALEGVERCGRTEGEIRKLIRSPAVDSIELLPEQSNKYFRLDFLRGVGRQEQYERGFAVIVVLDGSFCITSGMGAKTEVAAGVTIVMSYGVGDYTISGEGSLLIARPPVVKSKTLSEKSCVAQVPVH